MSVNLIFIFIEIAVQIYNRSTVYPLPNTVLAKTPISFYCTTKVFVNIGNVIVIDCQLYRYIIIGINLIKLTRKQNSYYFICFLLHMPNQVTTKSTTTLSHRFLTHTYREVAIS